MCDRCDYSDFLKERELEVTENRLRILEVLGNNNFPLSAGDIHKTLKRNISINRVPQMPNDLISLKKQISR